MITPISQGFDLVAELAHLDEEKFIQDSKQVLSAPNPTAALKRWGENTGLGGFMGGMIVKGTRQEREDLVRLLPNRRLRVETRLVRRPQQRLAKHVRIAWWFEEKGECYVHEFFFPLQFLGYGGYSLCHFDAGKNDETKAFEKFFSTLKMNRVNLHRTFIFTNGKFEKVNRCVVPLLDIPAGHPQEATVTTAFIKNLVKMADVARQHGVVLQICLFPRQSVEKRTDFEMRPPGLEASFSGTAPENILKFFKVGGEWECLQRRIIDAVTGALVSHWNVSFEIANELDLGPGINDPVGQRQLLDWVNATADYVRRRTYGKLQTTSCSRRVQASQFSLSTLDFGSVHRGNANQGGQWLDFADMEGMRAEFARYGDKHVVFDDDGKSEGRTSTTNIANWARNALIAGGVGPCSYNHKGHYGPDGSGFTQEDLDQLAAIKGAYESVFQPLRPGVGIGVPRPIIDRQV